MHRCRLLFLALWTYTALLSGQEADQRRREEAIRREKIEGILRIQDLRTPHDGPLRAALSDRDPLVRERAFLACGSIQDSTLLLLLLGGLTDPIPSVQEAAAFAVGQTGTLLSEDSRRALEEEILWKKLPESSARARLIEDLGRFGTAEALRQLVIRVGNVFPEADQGAMQLAVARFAMRGIVSDDGVRYLARFLRPSDRVPWQVMYALQRIGDHPLLRGELEQLVLARENPDPRVRMYLASLLGKMKAPGIVLSPLERMADGDPDWRVRVNAIKSLVAFGISGRPTILATMRRAFFDPNPYIALTALAAAGNSDISPVDTGEIARQSFGDLRLIAENRSGNFLWQLQGEAVSALAALTGPDALPLCAGRASTEPTLRAELLRAAGRTGSPEAFSLIAQKTDDDDHRVSCAALEGLEILLGRRNSDSSLPDAIYPVALKALEAPDVAVVTTAARLLGHARLLSRPAVIPLVTRFSSLRVPGDIEAYQEICSTLAKFKDPAAVPPLFELLKVPDRSVALAAAGALEALTGVNYQSRIPVRTEPLFTDLDFLFLRSLGPRVRATLETARGDIELELDPELAPFTVMAIAKLARQRGFYRGRTFHRVVPNFVVQGGDPRGDGWGGPGFTIRSEFSPLPYETGTVGIASAGKDTEGSQFFITQSPQPHLDGRYTIIGKVIRGQDVVDRILIDDRIYDLKFKLEE